MSEVRPLLALAPAFSVLDVEACRSTRESLHNHSSPSASPAYVGLALEVCPKLTTSLQASLVLGIHAYIYSKLDLCGSRSGACVLDMSASQRREGEEVGQGKRNRGGRAEQPSSDGCTTQGVFIPHHTSGSLPCRCQHQQCNGVWHLLFLLKLRSVMTRKQIQQSNARSGTLPKKRSAVHEPCHMCKLLEA